MEREREQQGGMGTGTQREGYGTQQGGQQRQPETQHEQGKQGKQGQQRPDQQRQGEQTRR